LDSDLQGLFSSLKCGTSKSDGDFRWIRQPLIRVTVRIKVRIRVRIRTKVRVRVR